MFEFEPFLKVIYVEPERQGGAGAHKAGAAWRYGSAFAKMMQLIVASASQPFLNCLFIAIIDAPKIYSVHCILRERTNV
jgi:hypothetical protein